MTFRSLLQPVLLGLFSVLFAGAYPASAYSSHARIIRLSLVQGDVRFTRDTHGDALADHKAAWETAALNLPIRQGYVLATDNGRAEVEFENGAMAFLDEHTVVEFYDLSLENGAKTTRLVLRQGTASFYVNPARGDYFSVTGGDFTVDAAGRTSFRLDNYDDGSTVNVLKGRVSVLHKDQTTPLEKGQSLSMHADDDSSVSIDHLQNDDEFDRWVSGRIDSVATATNAALHYVSSPYYSSGFGDLYTYGGWYPMGGYGNCWRPYGVGLGWSPFEAGTWAFDPRFGWSFVGFQPWGWVPYHFGSWIFSPVYGWLWVPGGFGYGGFTSWRPVTAVWVRNKGGQLGIVPVHPQDAHGKIPINLAQGVQPVNGRAISASVSVQEGENWKAIKTPPRDAVGSGLAATPAPVRVSRTVLAGNAGSRAVTIGRDSSIAYDPREHRFVNTNAPAAASTTSTEVRTGDAQARTGTDALRTAQPGSTAAPGTPAAAAVPRATATVRSSTPPPRTMTPPPPRASASSGAERGGSSRGEAPRSAPAPRPMAPAPRSAPAPHPAPSSGRPH